MIQDQTRRLESARAGPGRGCIAGLLCATECAANPRLEDNLDGWKRLMSLDLWDNTELENWLSQMSVSKFLKRGAKRKVEAIFDTGEDIDFDKRITGGQWADLLLDERDVMQSVNGHIGWFFCGMYRKPITKSMNTCAK